MWRYAHCWAALLALAAIPAASRGQGTLAPLYTLPKDGTWVEYEWKATGSDGKKQAGTLRISSVGRRTVGGVEQRAGSR